MRTCLLIAAGGLALALCVAAPASPATAPAATHTAESADSQFFRQRLVNAHNLARDGRHADAERAFAELIQRPDFARLPPGERRSTLSAAARTALELGKLDRAADLYGQATQADAGDPDDWYRLALINLDLQRYDASTQAFIHFIEHWPELLPKVDETALYQPVQQLPSDSPARYALLRALFDANWTSSTSDTSAAWFALTEAHVEHGKPEAARATAKRIANPRQLVRLRSDKRFDFLVEADSWTFNIDNAARRQVEAMRQKADAAPRSLYARVELSTAMLTAGLSQEVIALTDEVKQRIVETPADQPTFDDPQEQVWVMNNRAIALRRLGRTEEALAELINASQLSENGQTNVSQTLNLAVFYCSLGRPDDARKTIDQTGFSLSGYGRLVMEGVRYCSALARGEKASADKSLKYLREHRGDGPLAYLEALLRGQRVDEAAHLVIELLALPSERAETLAWAQDFRRAEPLPGDVIYRGARADVLARMDVQEAIAKVGRIGHYDIFGINETD